jgi:hypothetical protein
VPPPPQGVLPPQPPTPPPTADPVAARAALVTHLEAESTKFASWAGFFIFLSLLGSLGLGWVASQESVCDFGFAGSISCDTETDAAQFVIVALSTFVASLLFVLPLRGIASLLRGTAAVLETVDPGPADGDSL